MQATRKIATCIIILSPILAPYGIGGLSFGFILPLIACLTLILQEKKISYSVPKYYLYYLIYMMTIPAIASYFFYGKFDISFGEISLFLVLAIFLKHFDIEYGFKVYERVVLFLVIIFLLQYLSYIFLGHSFSGLVPFLPLVYNNIEMGEFASGQAQAMRQSSMFLEPAQFAQYLLPYLIITLFDKDNNSVVKAILITIVFILLQSGNGVLFCGLSWILFLTIGDKIREKNIILRVGLYLFIGLAIITVGTVFLTSEIGSGLLSRVNEFDSTNTTTSGFIRIYRGYIPFAEFDSIQKFVGISTTNNFALQLSNLRCWWMFDDELYLNSFQSKLIYSGILGTILYTLWVLSIIRQNSQCGKILCLILFLLYFIASISQPFFLLYILFAYGLKNKNIINYESCNNHNSCWRKLRFGFTDNSHM